MTGPNSSRIIVKNLPKWMTEERLRQTFGTKGQVTDIKMAYTHSGIFRRFAYVGYGSVEEAQEAVRYFDRTFIDTQRIQVQMALAAGSTELPRPWSKYSTGSSAYQRRFQQYPMHRPALPEEMQQRQMSEERAALERKKKILEEIYGEEGEERKEGNEKISKEQQKDKDGYGMRAFVNAASSISRTRVWENDGGGEVEVREGRRGVARRIERGESGKGDRNKKVQVEVKAVPNRRAGGAGQLLTKTHVKFADESDHGEPFGSGEESEELYEDLPNMMGNDEGREMAEAKYVSDDETKVEPEEEPFPTQSPMQDLQVSPKGGDESFLDTAKDREPSPELIAETGRLFVRNLSYLCTEEDLRRLFEPFGTLTEVHLSISRESKKSKGFAYILFMIPENALRAYTKLDGTIFQGRLLHILPALEKPSAKTADATTTTTLEGSYKAKKEKEQKTQAQSDYNWNALFIRSDTVLDAIAAKLGVPKASIMDARSDNLATRLALAETHLIRETKTYLEGEGVVLDAFASSSTKERSKTIILVKNLSFQTEASELRKLFGKFGTLGRVVLPPTKAVALIEFLEATEARTAFRHLAYSRFHNAPLFLEWAPIRALLPRAESVHRSDDPSIVRIAPLAPQKGENDLGMNVEVDEGAGADGEQVVPKKGQEWEADTIEQGVDGEASPLAAHPSACTLYVKNLNFSTTNDTLKTVFSAAGPVRSVRIATKTKNSTALSLGFGFVEFERRESLNRALDQLQGVVVDGHALMLQVSQGGPTTTGRSKRGGRSGGGEEAEEETANVRNTKLIVRNVPFEASEKEVKDLFKAFAQLKRVRLPRRFDGRHRGFGFVEFLTHQEAVNAREALAHTHLYGRHLVLEWAREEMGEGEEMMQASSSASVQLGTDEQLERLQAKAQARMQTMNNDRQTSKNKRVRLGGGKTSADDHGLVIPSDQDLSD